MKNKLEQTMYHISITLVCIGLAALAPFTTFAQAGKRHDQNSVRGDARLQVRMALVARSLKMTELMKRLEKLTKLKYSVDLALGEADFEMGGVQVRKGGPAWAYMNMIVYRAKMLGWQKPCWIESANGFVLTAERIVARNSTSEGIDRHYLRRDPRLQAKVSVVGIKPGLAEIIKQIETASDLKLTVSPVLSDHQPDFGEVRMRNTPAWAVMEMLARKQLENGRWVKTVNGYQLKAKSSLSARMRENRRRKEKIAWEQAALKSRFPLRADSRLRAKITIHEKNPNLSRILVRLQSATGVALALDDALTSHNPKYGQVQMPNTPAFTVMEMIANRQLKNGRWQKTADGYMLTGTSTAPSAQAQSGDWSVARIVAGVIIAIGGLAFAVFCALALFRRPANGPERTARK